MVAVSSIAAYAASKGPDGGGYTASDETIYSFIDISGAGGAAVTLAGTDDGTSAVTLPSARLSPWTTISSFASGAALSQAQP